LKNSLNVNLRKHLFPVTLITMLSPYLLSWILRRYHLVGYVKFNDYQSINWSIDRSIYKSMLYFILQHNCRHITAFLLIHDVFSLFTNSEQRSAETMTDRSMVWYQTARQWRFNTLDCKMCWTLQGKMTTQCRFGWKQFNNLCSNHFLITAITERRLAKISRLVIAKNICCSFWLTVYIRHSYSRQNYFTNHNAYITTVYSVGT